MNKKYLIIAVGLGSVIASGMLWYGITAPAKAAARNLAAINSLAVGETTEVELLSRPEFQKIERTCIQERCFYRMVAENTLLSRLHLAPRTFMGTTVMVRDGLVAEVSVVVVRAGRPAISLHQVEILPGNCRSVPCVRMLVPPSKILLGIRILFDRQSELRNHMPEAVNTGCLSRLRGCASYAELMPRMKDLNLEETSAGEVKARE